MPIKQKTPTARSEIMGETCTKVRVYSIAREVDSSTKDLERCIKNLKTQFGFDMETETFSGDDL